MTSTTKIEILQSGIWQLNSVIISRSGECIIIDPGYFPRELEDLVNLAKMLGSTKNVIFTHGHWDHIVGWSHFPMATVLGSNSLKNAIDSGSTAAQENLKCAQEFDSRWYVERQTSLKWPEIKSLSEGDLLEVGKTHIHVLETPGHSLDGLALFLKEEDVLLAGDYLSPLEIPFIDDLQSYRNTLLRFIDLLSDVKKIIPGHGPVLTSKQAREIALADLKYLDELETCVTSNDATSAVRISLPRAENVVGMRNFHLENCKKVGLSIISTT